MFLFFPKRLKIASLLAIGDFVCVELAYFLALFLRFDCSIVSIPEYYLRTFTRITPFYALGCIAVYVLAKLYNRVWRYASYRELQRCLLAGIISALAFYLVLNRLLGISMPLSYYVFGGFFQLAFLVGSRFSKRFLMLLLASSYQKRKGIQEVPAMLIGAGSAGQLVLRDLSTTSQQNIDIKCIIDDDSAKWGCYIEDIPVVGGRDQILDSVDKYGVQKIFVALPTASALQRQEILNICKDSGCEVKVLPGLYQFVDDEVSLAKMRSVSAEDLLGQEQVKVDRQEIGESLKDRVILVTGGGGAVGAELCRQIAEYAPKRLIILDIYENNAFYVQQELLRRFPKLDLVVLIGSVRDSRRIELIFAEYRPEIVFHAASHKHVPLMEASPCEAIKNNVFGTYKTAYTAMAFGCRRFVFLSSDKAVNPTSILGASSRLCEMIMQTMEHLTRTGQTAKLFAPYTHHHSHQIALPENPRTEFASIRFGNTFGDAMGKDGNVFNLFQKQIEMGGPVRVTHKDITRFVMSTPEAVRLILQAASFAKDGEVFVLDMGKPYRIDDLARSLIRLCGFIPDEDIRIEYTGLRPGEKLHEEPLMWEEGMRKTSCERVYVANPTRIDFDVFLKNLHEFLDAVGDNCADVRERMAQVVNSFHKDDGTASQVFEASLLSQNQSPIKSLECIATKFQIKGDVMAVVPMNKGYINRTYRVETADGREGRKWQYTLQRINTEVFPDANALMENFTAVTRHLQKHFQLPGRPGELANQIVIPTTDGKNFYEDPSGAWRMLSYIDHVHSYDIPENAEVFRYSGLAFGSFLKAISTLDPAKIHEVIPNFHNTWSRYQDLEKAIAADPVGRVASVQKEIDFVRAHKELFRKITDALENHEIPLRLGHNDCNLNNVLFDDETNQPVAVIDLDTVMPSSPLYDFGDSMRIGTNTAKDDEKDLSKVSCDLKLYEQYARGWLEACGDMLTAREKELLPYAALVITSEDGIRFLMDHINGDTYYYIFYQGQNLDRARTQLKLLADMEEKLPEIQKILGRIQSTSC